MAALSRKGDDNGAGGQIQTASDTVFANGIGVGIHTSQITPHGTGPHKSAQTTGGSSTVFADGKPVLMVGSGETCGHVVVQGSPNVNCT